METVLLFILGVVIAVLGLAISIALHEVGHLVPAKLFGVKVPQYMIGFGPTVFSKKIGETEYGLKLLPLGGYISMIGMYPPVRPGEAPRDATSGFTLAKPGEQGAHPVAPVGDEARSARHDERVAEEHREARRVGFLTGIIDDAREVSREGIGDDHDRTFYRLPVWKRVIIMAGGPAMNFILAIIFAAIVVTGFGVQKSTTTLQSVVECVRPATSNDTSACTASDQKSPGAIAGLQPGDTITRMNGEKITSWDQMSAVIQKNPEKPIQTEIKRGGQTLTVELTPRRTAVPVKNSAGIIQYDSAGKVKTREAGFVGISPTTKTVHESPAAAFPIVGQNIAQVFQSIVNLPARVVDAWNALWGAHRDPNGPVSIVGVGRMAGEVASQDQAPVAARAATLISLASSVNIALGMINLVPLPPLDGGQIAAALWEGIRRGFAKLFRRKDPGPVDAAKLVPLTIVVAGCLAAMMALFVLVDIVNPVNLFG